MKRHETNGRVGQEEIDKKTITKVDKYNLDEGFEEQADKVIEYSHLYAEAELDVNELTDELKVVEAMAEDDIRRRPKRYRIKGPVREAAVKLKVVLHADVRQTKRKLNRAKFRLSLLKGVLKALDHRKTSLENLNDQDKRGYFHRPSKYKTRLGDDEFRKGVGKKRVSD